MLEHAVQIKKPNTCGCSWYQYCKIIFENCPNNRAKTDKIHMQFTMKHAVQNRLQKTLILTVSINSLNLLM